MNNGKEVCRRLKQVRSEIARANHIPYEPHECTHEGDCMGTCPRCEQEMRYLAGELQRRRQLGKAVKIVGVAALTGTAAIALSACMTAGEPPEPLTGDPVEPVPPTAYDQYDKYECLQGSRYVPLILEKLAFDYLSWYSQHGEVEADNRPNGEGRVLDRIQVCDYALTCADSTSFFGTKPGLLQTNPAPVFLFNDSEDADTQLVLHGDMDWSMLDEDWVLHIACRSLQGNMAVLFSINDSYVFKIGERAGYMDELPSVGELAGDGSWCEFEIPVSDMIDAGAFEPAEPYTLQMIIGNQIGGVEIDAVFFYKK